MEATTQPDTQAQNQMQPQKEERVTLGKPNRTLVAIGFVVLVAVAAGILWAATKGTVVKEETVGTTKTTTTEAGPSDTLLSTGVALGGLLILTGILWSRIKTIKGAGIELALESDEVGKAKDAVAKEAKKANKTEPEEVSTATVRALPHLRRMKARKGELDSSDFAEAARISFESLAD